MFKNRHVIIAMLVAPLLAILAWFAVGSFVGEKATPAQPGQSYPLVARSNCRWASGQCDLENSDLRLTLSRDGAGKLTLRSSHALEDVLLAVATPGSEAAPDHLRRRDAQGLEWSLDGALEPAPDALLRLVAAAAGSSYFAETGVAFLGEE